MAPPMKNCLLLILIFISLGAAWVLPSIFEDTTSVSALLPRQEQDNDPSNGCGPTCQACKAQLGCTPQAPPEKRGYQEIDPGWLHVTRLLDGNYTDTAWDNVFGKRALEDVSQLNQADLGAYLTRRGNSRGSFGLVRSRLGSDLSFTRTFRFADRQANGLVVGTQGGFLTGCTILTVVSRRAVYMGHFWQNLGFENLDENDDEPADFQRNVANLINGDGNLFYASGDALNPDLFNVEDDGTFAAIMTPRYARGAYYFPDQVARLEQIVRARVPGVHLVTYGYVPITTTRPTRGVALFEYDPDADGEGNGDWRLWYEGNVHQGRLLGQNVLGRNS